MRIRDWPFGEKVAGVIALTFFLYVGLMLKYPETFTLLR